MPGFSLGCPQKLRVSQQRGKRDRPTTILAMALDPSGHFLAVLTRHELQIWQGGHYNVLLGWADTHKRQSMDRLEQIAAEDEDSYVRCGLIWDRSSKEVCVLHLDGTVAFYSVRVMEGAHLFSDIEPPEWVDVDPGYPGMVGASSSSVGPLSPNTSSPVAAAMADPSSPCPVVVRESRGLEGIRASCLSAGLWSQHLLFGTNKAAVIMDVTWAGQIATEYHLRTDAEERAEVSEEATSLVLQIAYSDVCHLLAAVLSDGMAVVCNIPSATPSVIPLPLPPDLKVGHDSTGMVESVSFSPADATLAVGYDDGSVAIFRVLYANNAPSPPSSTRRRSSAPPSFDPLVSETESTPLDGMPAPPSPSPGQSRRSIDGETAIVYPTSATYEDIALSLYRRLHLSALGFEMRHVGPVMCMEFSPDGGSLAVAHGWSSLNVWNTSQWCRPMTTFPRVPHTPVEPANVAIACVLWAYHGYRLLVAQNQLIDLLSDDDATQEDEQAAACIMRYEMMKWARQAPMSDTPLCLQGVSSVALLEQRPWNPRLLCWAHITTPPAYAVNLPIDLVALSPSSQNLALAGRRGLAVYYRGLKKWRLFGNVHQERELKVAGLAWWGEDSIIVIARQRTSFSILLYPKNHLDNSALLSEPVPLPPGTRPLFVDCVTENESGRSNSNAGGPSTAKGPPGILLVGDTNFLLFYRLAHTATGVLVSFLYDLKVPVQRGPNPLCIIPGGEDLSVSLSSTIGPMPRRQSNRDDAGGPGGTEEEPFLRRTSFSSTSSFSSSMGYGEVARRIYFLPDVHPRAVALLSSQGNLYRVEVSSGALSMVAREVANLWELKLPSQDERLAPCYLLYCGDHGFSMWLPSFRDERASILTFEACQRPFLEPTFNPDVEGVVLGLHSATNSLIFLTQTCVHPNASSLPHGDHHLTIPPRYEIGLQRRPIYQVVLRYLLFLHGMMRSKVVPALGPPPSPSVLDIVYSIFDELFSQAETRIHLADALDFLLRSSIEAVAIAHSRLKKNATSKGKESYFVSLPTATEQVRDVLLLCRREKTLTLFYEVIVRVARKVEPSRQKYIFPLPDLNNQGYGDTPVSLFEKCLQSRKLHTAILYLPLIDEHTGGLGNLLGQSPGRARMSSTSSNAGGAYASATDDLPDLQLVLALSLRLLWECLRRGSKEWRMLKQLWRFTLKREEAVRLREEERRWLGQPSPRARSASSSSTAYHPESTLSEHTAQLSPRTSQENGGSILSFLYRLAVGRAATTPGGTQAPLRSGGGGGGGGHFAFEGGEAGSFNILKYARGGKDCLAAFASMCLATLRLQDLVEVLLLLASHHPDQIPYPPPLREPVASLNFPWTHMDDHPGRIVDCYIAVREQFTNTPSTAAMMATASSRPDPVSVETKLQILLQVCTTLQAFDCVVAIGTRVRDASLISTGLEGMGLLAQDYKAAFLDQQHDLDPVVRSFVADFDSNSSR